MIAARLIAVAIAYLIGSFQTGYFYGKKQGIDIRDHGSGNSGTTNTMRVLGKKAGAITFIGDTLKAIIAIGIIYLIFGSKYPDTIRLLGIYGGLGVVLGHNYPFYMNFRGGKGVACTVGVAIMTALPAVPISCLSFILTVVISKYVSLGSLIAYSVLLIEVVVLGLKGYLGVPAANVTEFIAIYAFLTAMAFWRHRANIKRLATGTENKIGHKAK